MILLATLYLAYLLTDASGDVAIEQGRQAAWHRWGAAQAGLFMAVLAFAVYGISWYALGLFVALVILRFPVFNIMHNLIKGDKWYYLSDHGIDGFVKRLLNIKP